MALLPFDLNRLVPDVRYTIVDKKNLSTLLTNTVNCFKSSSAIRENRRNSRNMDSENAIQMTGPGSFYGSIETDTADGKITTLFTVDLEPDGYFRLNRLLPPGVDPSAPYFGINLKWHLPLNPVLRSTYSVDNRLLANAQFSHNFLKSPIGPCEVRATMACWDSHSTINYPYQLEISTDYSWYNKCQQKKKQQII